MGVGRFSRPLRGVGLVAMPDAGLDMTRRIESVCMVLLGAAVLRLLEPGMAFGIIIDRRCIPEVVEVTRCVISATRELCSKVEGLEF
jgi:hypothetical protein